MLWQYIDAFDFGCFVINLFPRATGDWLFILIYNRKFSLCRYDPLIITVFTLRHQQLSRLYRSICIYGLSVQIKAFLIFYQPYLPCRHAKDGAQHLIRTPSLKLARHRKGKSFFAHFSSTLEYLHIISTISSLGSIRIRCFCPSRIKKR